MQWHDIHRIFRDDVALLVIHVGLLLLLGYGLFRRFYVGRGTVTLSVKRGPETMAKLAGGFAVATIGVTLAVDVADAWCGFKTAAIAADYCVLAYLFFWNVWFRNRFLNLVIGAHNESV